jgi:NTE family protein
MIKSIVRAIRGDPSPALATKRVNLALQGGGAYGAFSWGVLDHLLEDGRLEIEGITGASAGAVNAVLLADGLARGRREEARKRLADFWRAASLGGGLPDLQRKALDRLLSFLPAEDSPMGVWFKAVSQYLSPYDFNPLNINPAQRADRTLRRFRRGTKIADAAAVRQRHQCPYRAVAHFPA